MIDAGEGMCRALIKLTGVLIVRCHFRTEFTCELSTEFLTKHSVYAGTQEDTHNDKFISRYRKTHVNQSALPAEL